MKDEIKEIVRRMNNLIKHQFDKEYHTECDLFKDIQGLLDYITNLQKENNILKENAIHNDKVVDKAKWNEMLYKSKCEKAIEYYNNCIENLELSKINDNEKLAYQVAYEIHKNYLNILQGSDKK